MTAGRTIAVYAAICAAGFLATIALGLEPGGRGHDGYVEISRSLAECGTFGFACSPTTGRSPFYPVLLLPAHLGLSIWWVTAWGFAALFLAALLTRLSLSGLNYRHAGLAAGIICLNPAMLMLAKNGMPYATILLATAWAAWTLLERRHAQSMVAGGVLYFMHPSLILLGFAVSALGLYGSLRSGKDQRRVLVCAVAVSTLVALWQLRILDHYGSIPLTSATGSGFQYERARNQYTDGEFFDERTFARAGVVYEDSSIELSVVRQDQTRAVDISGRTLMAADLKEPAFFIPKLLMGLRNTFFSGFLPELVVLPAIYLALLGSLLGPAAGPDRTQPFPGKRALIVAVSLHIGLLAVVGFKMRYGAYFICLLGLLPALLPHRGSQRDR